ncbi:MAG TPA: hypothetical protein DER09_07575 [Prolixibacteraceae bacterium]|nr:hypothetical protein [Prolixibacteraceae bacterium]
MLSLMESMQANQAELINYRIEQAKAAISDVTILIEKNLLTLAINRIYYGMFYMLLALALKRGFKTSKHNQLIGWFNKEYIKTGIIDTKFGKIVNKGFEDRTDGDYGIFVQFEKEEVLLKLSDMKEFISEIEANINRDI